MNKSKVLAFGEVLWDFIEGDKHFGGAPVNFAAHMVQCGREAGIISALGNDKLGEQALDHMKQLRLDTSLVQRNKHLTGRVMVFLENGQPTYRIRKEVAYDFINQNLIDLNQIKDYEAFYFGTLSQRSKESREALYHVLENSRFSTIYYDVNLRRDSFSEATIRRSLGYCNIAKMNHEEVEVIAQLLYHNEFESDQLSLKLFEENESLETIIVTSGKAGCQVITRKEKHEVSGKLMPVKDSVGAGDAFSAAFLDVYLKTNDPKKAARIGNMVGGFVVSESGAIPRYPEDFRRKIEILSA